MAESIDSSLRHTLATDMLRGAEDRKGADLRTVQAMMGHKNTKTTEQYQEPLRATEDRPIGRFFPH